MTPLPALRPQNDTAAEVRASLSRIRTEADTTTRRVDALRLNRRDLLATGTPKTIAAVDAEIQTLEIWLEQLADLADLIQPKLLAADGAEIRAGIVEAVERALAAAAEFDAWARAEYADIATRLTAGLAKERLALRLRRDATEHLRQVAASPALAAAGGVPVALFHKFPETLGEFTGQISLPAFGSFEGWGA